MSGLPASGDATPGYSRAGRRLTWWSNANRSRSSRPRSSTPLGTDGSPTAPSRIASWPRSSWSTPPGSVSPVACQRRAPRSYSVVSSLTPAAPVTASRTRTPSATTSGPMPPRGPSAGRSGLGVVASVTLSGRSRRRYRAGPWLAGPPAARPAWTGGTGGCRGGCGSSWAPRYVAWRASAGLRDGEPALASGPRRGSEVRRCAASSVHGRPGPADLSRQLSAGPGSWDSGGGTSGHADPLVGEVHLAGRVGADLADDLVEDRARDGRVDRHRDQRLPAAAVPAHLHAGDV